MTAPRSPSLPSAGASRLALVGSTAAVLFSSSCGGKVTDAFAVNPRLPAVATAHSNTSICQSRRLRYHAKRPLVSDLSAPLTRIQSKTRDVEGSESNVQNETREANLGKVDDEACLFVEADTGTDLAQASTLTTEADSREDETAISTPADFDTTAVVSAAEEESKINVKTKVKNDIGADEDDEGSIDAPSVRQILRFAVPAIGVWLCSPILSMIDTSAVGLLSGTAQQAALNPAVSVTDYGGLLVAFMYTATTNLVAAAQQTDRSDPSKPLTAWTLKSALGLALLVGVGFGLFLSVFARLMLRTLIGNDSLDPFIFSAALRYVRIRCLGMPAAVVIGTAQSACLGMQDLKSPLYVLLAAAVINFLGDAIFVRSPSLWIGGAAGAAWATVFSQYAALAMFLRWFQTEPGHTRSKIAARISTERIRPNSSSLPGTAANGSPSESSIRRGPPSRGFLSGRFSVLDMFRIPDAKAIREFLPYVGPVTATAVGRISGYLAMSHVASSALGTIDMAAQQIIFSFFCCLTPVCDSLNLTAQSFVPPIFSWRKSRARADALRQTLKSFLGAGGVMGVTLVGLVAMIPFLGMFFTTDMAVMSQVNTAIPGLALFFALSGVVCVGEGMLLGQRDLKFLGNAYGAYFFAVPAVLLRLKRRALAGLEEVGVGTMWKTFSCYQVVRCAIWLIRMIQLQRRTEHDGDEVVAEPVEG